MRFPDTSRAAPAGRLDLVSPLAKLKSLPFLFALGALPLGLLGGGCASEQPAPNGICSLAPELDCRATIKGNVAMTLEAGLVGYSCTGTARPDDSPSYQEEVPDGIVCADRPATVDGQNNYCCSPNSTTCALDPAIPCSAGNSGYQCRGKSRPEAFNAAVKCGNGVIDDPFIDYCCSGQPVKSSCVATDGIGCDNRLTGFTCGIDSNDLPTGEDLGANESRADYYRFLCPVARLPGPDDNQTRVKYCCYMPAPPLEGFSCVQDTKVPGCAGGRFGFACYGYDTPSEDYPVMNCPEPGFTGKSAEGYQATLYCCDFQ